MNIRIDKNLCTPSECEHECVSICPQNSKGKEAIKVNKNLADIVKSNCINCLYCVYVCPFEAIKAVSKSKKTIPISQLKREKQSKETLREKKPFEVNEDVYEPFNEKYTIFSRRMWDEEYAGYQKPIFAKVQERAALGLDGYSEIEGAAVDAAWSIENLVSMNEFQNDRLKTLAKEDLQKLEAQKAKDDVKQVNYDVQEPFKYNIEKPEEITLWLKKISKFFGADLVGIARCDRKWIYTHDRMDREYVIPKTIKYAVVLAVEMDLDAINTTPKMPGGIATGLGYSKIAFIRTLVSSFIKNLGYEAIPAGNSLGISVPLAVEAGLGGWGRHGLLITRDFGPRVRIAKILTDIPLVPDKPDYKFSKSVERFCRTCKTCAQKCPSASIPFDKYPSYKTTGISNNPGVRKWYVNVETCYLFWLENAGDCSVCISDCEYNHKPTWWHKIANWIVMYFPVFNPLWPYIGKMLGFGGNKSAKKFWKKIKV